MPDSLRRPHFAHPPVVEVACGVQFEGLEQWRTPHYGQFGAAIRDAYPETEDQPPLARVRLDASATFDPQWSFLPPLRRVFFISPPGNFLIQLQPNRLLHNWRKVADGDQYPRFDAAFEKFIWTWEQFNKYLSSAGLPRPKPEAWELTYINHIVARCGRRGSPFTGRGQRPLPGPRPHGLGRPVPQGHVGLPWILWNESRSDHIKGGVVDGNADRLAASR